VGQPNKRNASRPGAESTDFPPAVAWLFPGLGSRFVGMGADIIGQHAAADELIAAAQQLIDADIAEVCLSGSGRKKVPARIEAQVIYTLNCAYANVLMEAGVTPQVVCGHSLGTWAAAFAAGCYDFQTGLELVTAVEEALDRSTSGGEQAMGVVLGLEEATVLGLLKNEIGVYLANRNAPGQYVIAGTDVGVDALLSQATELGAKKARRIAGERAMHTPLIDDVTAELQERLANVDLADPQTPLVNCAKAKLISTAAELRDYLGRFLNHPVNWQAAVEILRVQGITQFCEVGPAAVLTGMMPYLDSTLSAMTVSDWLQRSSVSETTDLISPV